MECNKIKNKAGCPCTYEPCTRKGVCCECVAFHQRSNEVPGCFFTKQGESSYDRSIAAFIRDQKAK